MAQKKHVQMESGCGKKKYKEKKLEFAFFDGIAFFTPCQYNVGTVVRF